MTDMEKVVRGLECHYKGCEHKDGSICPYWENDSCGKQLVSDALALLKEQEAVDPICQIIFDVPYYFCGSCKTMLNMYAVKAKYCSNCARRVKWK